MTAPLPAALRRRLERLPPQLRASLARERGTFVRGAVALLATNLFVLALPMLLRRGIHALEAGDAAGVRSAALLMAAAAALQAATRTASRLVIFNAARRVEHDMRRAVFDHLTTLSPATLRGRPAGDLMTRTTNDVQSVRMTIGVGVLHVVNTAAAYAGSVGAMAWLDPSLALAALVPLPLVALATRRVVRDVYARSRERQDELGRLSAYVTDRIAAHATVRAYARGAGEAEAFRRRAETYRHATMKLAWSEAMWTPLFAAAMGVGTVLVLGLGGPRVARGELSLGDLVAFIGYLAALAWPTLATGWIVNVFQNGAAALARIDEVLALRPTIVDPPAPAPLADASLGAIAVRALTVEAGGARLLDAASLDARPGEVLAVVGETGSGKSTLLAAMARLVEVPPATVLFGGRDVTELSVSSVRASIGYAPQEGFLFSATIAENVALGAPDAPRDDVLAACRAAGLAPDLASFPDGVDTLVGERGVTLSGGQRQRVALARAILPRPPLLLLDDCFSSVDPRTEREIMDGLLVRGAAWRPTIVVASHRLAIAERADRVVVLERGRVAEAGTSAELLARGGIYARLHALQALEDESRSAREAGAA